jgi:small subunit ribosomal protein S20
MATHKSAEKRARQNVKRNTRNRSNLSTMRTSMKKLRDAIEKKDVANLDNLLRETQSVIAKTHKKGAIHANNMARKISRLAAAVSKAKGYVPAPKV